MNTMVGGRILVGALSLCAAAAAGAQAAPRRVATDLPGEDVVIALEPMREGRGPRWSPKGEHLALTATPHGLEGRLALGPEEGGENAPIRVVLSHSTPAGAVWGRLGIDIDRDGVVAAEEQSDCEPSLRNGKTWTNWSWTIPLHVVGPDGQRRVVDYPIDLWFVVDPGEPDEAPSLRWTRRGWMQGQVQAAQGPMLVAVSEMHVDGVYDRRDAWIVAANAKGIETPRYRAVDDHAWLGEHAWRIVSLHPSGLQVTLRRCDPGTTREQEDRARDEYAVDRAAPRAALPLAFGHDFAAAEELARRERRPLFVDFETSWCGPCKQMDQLIYTAKAVVDAATAAGVVAVKVDADRHRDVAKRFEVVAFPTMILLDADGGEQRRLVGYHGIAAMVAFLGGGARAEDLRSSADDPARDVMQLLFDGERAFDRGDMQATKAAYEQVLKLDSGNGIALRRLGMVLEEAGDLEGALARFEQAAQDPRLEAQMRVKQASLLTRLKRHREARDLLRIARKLTPAADLGEVLAKLDRMLDPEVVSIDEVDAAPKPVAQPQPEVPETLRQRPAADVTVAFVVAVDGSVDDVYVVATGDVAFDEVVLAAVRQWQFEPGTRKGSAVRVRMQDSLRMPADR